MTEYEPEREIEPIEGELQALPALLAGVGLTPEETEYGYRCRNLVGTKDVGWNYFLSAKYLTRMPAFENPRRKFEWEFRKLQREVLGEIFSSPGRPHINLYLVGTTEEIAELDSRGFSYQAETDQDYALKWFGTLEELEDHLGGAFATLPASRKAHKEPRVALLHSLSERTADQPAPAKVFVLSRIDADTPAALLVEEKAAERELIAKIYHRILGRSFSLEWTESEALFSRPFLQPGVSRVFASSGERAAFDLACFLAQTASNVTPGLGIGIHCALTHFCILGRMRLMGVLQEFIVATGVSVEIQAESSSVRSMATKLLGKVALT